MNWPVGFRFRVTEDAKPIIIAADTRVRYNYFNLRRLQLPIKVKCSDDKCHGMSDRVIIECMRPMIEDINTKCSLCGRPLLAEVQLV